MAKEKKVTLKEQVRQLIKEGKSTKAEIAEALDISTGSVSSQMTYLRWANLFIKYDDDKVLSFVTEDEWDVWQAELKANRKTKTTTKDPQARSNTLAKTMSRQADQLTKWQDKLDSAKDMIDGEDDVDQETQDIHDEAAANVTLLEIKLSRNTAIAKTLPEPADEVGAEDAEDAEEDSDELL